MGVSDKKRTFQTNFALRETAFFLLIEINILFNEYKGGLRQNAFIAIDLNIRMSIHLQSRSQKI
jgi:hypothetical protein